MRVIAKRTLRLFWETHPRGAAAKTPLEDWYEQARETEWVRPTSTTGSMRRTSDMCIAPIKSEAGCEAALAEIATLMDAERDTPEGGRLDVLATLVEAYEARHWTIDPPEPIDAIRIRME
jgi:hypothetical protein